MKRAIGVASTLVSALVVFFLVGLAFQSQTYASPTGVEVAKSLGMSTLGGKPIAHVALSLDVFPDASGSVNGRAVHPGGNPAWPSYGFTNQLQAPANTLVTMTIRQYDSGGALNNPYFAKVVGTVDGTETVDGKVVRVIDSNATGHTFTLRGFPGIAPGFLLNAPLPLVGNAAGDNVCDTPGCPVHTVVFSFVTGGKGHYAWNCEYPCGLSVAGFGAVMGANGYMSGFLNVV